MTACPIVYLSINSSLLETFKQVNTCYEVPVKKIDAFALGLGTPGDLTNSLFTSMLVFPQWVNVLSDILLQHFCILY